MDEKLYTIAGTSVLNGQNTYRFASGSATAREKVLLKNGHTDVKFMELPKPMTLKDAVAFLSARGITAVLPHGQRKGPNGGPREKKVQDTAEQAAESPVEAVPEVVETVPEVVAETFGQRMARLKREKKAREAAEQAEAVPA